MSANITNAWDEIVAQLDGAGLRAVADPRNIQPPCVIVEAPSVSRAPSVHVLELEFPIAVIGPPPGNRDSALWMLGAVDEIAGIFPIRDGSPGSYSIGTTELPAYLLTIITTIRRTLT